jgi:hypothetical protein
MANKGKTESSVVAKDDAWEKEEVSELDQMKIRMAELEKQLKNALENKDKEVSEVEEPDYPRDIRQDEYISVMSLIPWTLNLSTEGMGKGKIKKFTHFGEIKRILYSELVDIMDVHPNFLNSGLFYIMDKDVIRRHGLNDVYDKILDKEKIEKILDTKTMECVELYESANDKQREVIVKLLVEKMKEDPDSVNLNVIDKISRISDTDIREKVQDSLAFEKALLEEDK